MARKPPQKKGLLMPLLGAALIGVLIGVWVYNPFEPAPPIPTIEFTDPYDDSWGRLSEPNSRATVTHILIAWDGTNVNTQKAPRSKEEARKLVEQVWHQYKANPTEANWKNLQRVNNEDSAPHTSYDIPGSLVQPFQDTGKSTKVGHARICESQFGFHLIRREK
ncbi:MAG: peptidylprolyl isomerase [Planctomycetes bacterium]|nr:peptidylprolyl isomerase [Planctomycetota bacterium]